MSQLIARGPSTFRLKFRPGLVGPPGNNTVETSQADAEAGVGTTGRVSGRRLREGIMALAPVALEEALAAKAGTSVATSGAAGLMAPTDKAKLDAQGVSLLGAGCVPCTNPASCVDNWAIISGIVEGLANAGGGTVLIDGLFAVSQAVPLRSYVRFIPVKPGQDGFIAHPTSVDNVIGEHHAAGGYIESPYFGAGLVVDGNKQNCAYNTAGPNNDCDDAYQNGVRLCLVRGLRAPHIIIRNTVFNGYSDYFYGIDNCVGHLELRSIGKEGALPTGARSYNGAWIEFCTTNSTICYLDVDGARERGYYLTTGYPTAYPDAVQINPAVLGGRIRNTGSDAICAEISGGAHGYIKNLRLLDIDVSESPSGTIGCRLAGQPGGTSGIINPHVRMTARGCGQHGLFAYNGVSNLRLEGHYLDNGDKGVVIDVTCTDTVVDHLVSLGNVGGNLVDTGTRTRRGLGVVVDTSDVATVLTRAMHLITNGYPQLKLEAGNVNVGLGITRGGVGSWDLLVEANGDLALYGGGNEKARWTF